MENKKIIGSIGKEWVEVRKGIYAPAAAVDRYNRLIKSGWMQRYQIKK